MRGLDPRIHLLTRNIFAKKMDCRAKPGNDGGGRGDYVASSFDRAVAAATARSSSGWNPSGPISTDSAAAVVPPGWVTVGTEVNVRHLAASPVGATIRTVAEVIEVERRVIRFSVEAYHGETKIGDGRHGRGLINVEQFKKRFAVP